MVPEKQKHLKYSVIATEIIAIVLFLLLSPAQAYAEEKEELSFPNFQIFLEDIMDGKEGVLRGVYVPDILAYPVMQQPVGHPGFVSQEAGVVTQFGMAAEVGNVGLLAHNHLAGQSFTNLAAGDEVRLVYGDGEIEYFIVTELLEYQALQPYSPYSEFRDLDTSHTLTAEELFGKVYRGERHVTFQVCIAANGIDAWGRLFVVAQPKSNPFVEHEYLRHKLAFQIN